MSRLLIICLGLCFNATSFAQQQNPFLNDANGRPLYWGSTYRQEGSPYFHNEYNWAEIVSSNGTFYKDVRIKYNVVEHKVQYIGDDGVEMLANSGIRSIRFPLLVSEDGSRVNVKLVSNTGILNEGEPIIYELLDSGKISLLKKISITYRDDKKYGEAVITRHYDRKETEFVKLANGEYKKLEKTRSFILEITADKLKEIDTYINANNIKCKSTKDFQLIISYYNSLQ